MESGLYVSIKDVTERATGLDMPAYVRITKGTVGYFDEIPDPEIWQPLCIWTGTDSAMVNRIVYKKPDSDAATRASDG